MMKFQYSPTILLNRLIIVRDQQVVYDQKFHEGMNVIYGKNAFGKSCIMDMIFYVLGGYLSETEWKKEIKYCTAVYGEFVLNGEIFTLKRNIENPPFGGAAMSICEGNLIHALSCGDLCWKKYNYNESKQRESFSNFLFQILGIPEIKISELDHAITMNSCLRLMYVDQRTPYFEIFRNETYDSETKRKVISDLMLGVYNTDYYLLKNKLKKLEDNFKNICNYLSNVLSVLNTTGNASDPAFFEKLIENKKKELDNKIDKLSSSKKDFYSEFAKKNGKEEINKIVQDIEETNVKISESTSEFLKLNYEKIDSQNFISSLERRLSFLEDSEKTMECLDSIEVDICPVCFSEIKKHQNEDNCYLCHSPLKGEARSFNLNKLKRNLLMQIQESQSLQDQRELEIQNISRKIKFLKNTKDRLQKDLSLKSSTVFQNEVYFLKLNEEVGYLRKDIENLEKQKDLADNLKLKVEEKENLNQEIVSTKGKIEQIIKGNEARLNQALNKVKEKLKELLLSDVGADKDLKNVKDIEINFTKNRLFLDERTNFAASTMGYIKNCFSISLWEAAVENSFFIFPRFLLLDNIEDKGIDSERIFNIQSHIDEFCNNSSIQCQIIISASQLDQKFINTDKIIGKYYYDEETTGKTLDFSSKVVLSDLVS